MENSKKPDSFFKNEDANNQKPTNNFSPKFTYSHKKTIAELFEERAAKCPNKTAVVYDDISLTYKELNRRSNQLAHFLRNAGAKADTLVALSVSSDFHLIIGILGILKAGATYFPLDPSYPPERLKFLLADAQPTLILTQSDCALQFSDTPCETVLLDKQWHEIAHFNENNPSQINKPEDLAYIIYTSGSTGKPKGVMIEHSGLVNVVFSRMHYYPDPIKILLLGSIGFDMSIMIIFHALLSGGTLVLPKEQLPMDAEKVLNLIQTQAIDFLLCVPSLYAALLQNAPHLPTLKYVVLGGESVPPFLPELHAKLIPHAFFYNEYGPTECSICTTVAKIYDPQERKVHAITIGKPLANASVYILDQQGQHLPAGAKGELCIGGIGLARGYLNNPTLTAERFIWSTIPTNKNSSTQVRLYRTGDYGRFLPSGDIEFIGRLDNQVKIRGYRIELGEIEHAIKQYEGIKEPIVLAREEPTGHKRLIAYFSLATQVSIPALRSYLSTVLPKYMIPSVFIEVAKFPLTANGKIDRAALLQPTENKISKSSMPQSRLEQSLLNIWEKVLQCKTISIQDNFFDIGGDSLLVAQVQNLLRELLNLKVPIIDLFQYPTITQLARHLNKQRHDASHSHSVTSKTQVISHKKKAAFQRLRKLHLNKELISDG